MREFLIAALLIASIPSVASAYEIHEAPGSHTTNIFIGDHDERIEFRQYLRVHVSSEGGTEKVLFHPVTHGVGKRTEGYRIEDLTPNETAFLQNDFVQVSIVLKSTGAMETMDALRASIDLELSREGVPHAIDTDPVHAYFFPRGSFEVLTGNPPRLSRLYMDSKERRYVVTSRIPDPGDLFADERAMIRDSLGEFLKRQEAEVPQIPLEHPETYHSRWLAFWIPLQLVLLVGLLAALYFGRPGAIRILAALLVFPNAASVIGWTFSTLAPRFFADISSAFIPLALPNIIGGIACVLLMRRWPGRRLSAQGSGGIAIYLATLTYSSFQMKGAIGNEGQAVLPIVAFKWAALLAYPLAVLWVYFSRPAPPGGSE